MPSNQSPKMVRASVSAKFCLHRQICLNCSCLSLIVPGALISRLLIFNTHFTSKATSNPQQVSGALKIIETTGGGGRHSLFVKGTFSYLLPAGPHHHQGRWQQRCWKAVPQWLLLHWGFGGWKRALMEKSEQEAKAVQPNKVTVIIKCCQSPWKSN